MARRISGGAPWGRPLLITGRSRGQAAFQRDDRLGHSSAHSGDQGSYRVQRVYYLAVMERAPHFHLWLVPKKNVGELLGVAYLAQQPPLTTSYSETEAMSRKIRELFEQS